MKTKKLFFTLALLALSTLHPELSQVFAQGSLTPPGAPAPMMKSLDQLEPRTPVDAIHTPGNATNLFLITQSGSYYLTTNIIGVAGKNGIGILASNVTLDLCGFALTAGGTGSLWGVTVVGSPASLKICNGRVSNWGSGGINLAGGGGCDLERLNADADIGPGFQIGDDNRMVNCTVVGIGVNSNGILIGNDCVVTGCLVVSNYDGIDTGARCQINACVANRNFNGIHSGDHCSLLNCSATAEIGSGTGFTLGNECLIKDCLAGTNFNGILTQNGCTIASCTACQNNQAGIYSGKDCTITGSTTWSNVLGLVTGDRCTVTACSVAENTFRGMILGGECTAIGCSVSANGTVGISTAGNGTIKDCTVDANTGYGISAGGSSIVVGCTAIANTTAGIYTTGGCTIKDSLVVSNGTYGILGGVGCTVSGCTANANGGGFSLNSESSIIGCTASANNTDGIVVTYSCLIKDDTTASNSRYVVNGGAGIHALNSGNRIEGNVSNSDQYGIKADSTGNIVTRNTVRSAGSADYNLVTGNVVGTIIAATTSGAISGNTGGSGLGTTDPWANFSF